MSSLEPRALALIYRGADEPSILSARSRADRSSDGLPVPWRTSLACLLAATAVAWANGGHGPSPLEACRRAQDAMRDRLAAESIKVFQPCIEADVVRSGNRWRVATYVDTENLQGRVTRLNFAAVLEYRPTAIPTWTLTCIGPCP